MTVYIWLVVLLVVSAFLFNGNQKHNKKFLFIAFVLLFAVIGLRDVNAFGSDAFGISGSYSFSYQKTGNLDWNSIVGKREENYNIGFQYLMKFIYELTNGDYQAFITILSLFFVFSYIRFIEKYSPAPFLSILCFLGMLYYSFLFDALKQALAMSILLFAFDCIVLKRPIKFIVIVLIASVFHFPAIVFFPAYWVSKMKVGRKYVILLALLLFITYLFRDSLLKIMLDIYGNEDINVTMQGIRFLRNKAMIMIAIVLFALFISPPTKDDTVYNSMLLFAGIAIVFQTFCGYNNIFERLADYYFHTAIILIPLIFEKNWRHVANTVAGAQRVKTYGKLIIGGFAIWRFLSYMYNSGIFTPYRFFWQ